MYTIGHLTISRGLSGLFYFLHAFCYMTMNDRPYKGRGVHDRNLRGPLGSCDDMARPVPIKGRFRRGIARPRGKLQAHASSLWSSLYAYYNGCTIRYQYPAGPGISGYHARTKRDCHLRAFRGSSSSQYSSFPTVRLYKAHLADFPPRHTFGLDCLEAHILLDDMLEYIYVCRHGFR